MVGVRRQYFNLLVLLSQPLIIQGTLDRLPLKTTYPNDDAVQQLPQTDLQN